MLLDTLCWYFEQQRDTLDAFCKPERQSNRQHIRMPQNAPLASVVNKILRTAVVKISIGHSLGLCSAYDMVICLRRAIRSLQDVAAHQYPWFGIGKPHLLIEDVISTTIRLSRFDTLFRSWCVWTSMCGQVLQAPGSTGQVECTRDHVEQESDPRLLWSNR